MKSFSFIIAIVFNCGFTLADQPPPELNPKDKLIVETVLRLKTFDIESSARAKAAILRYLQAQPGTDQYFELIERFKPVEIADDLAGFSLAHATETSGVRGAELLFAMDQGQKLQAFVKSDDPQKSVAAVSLIGHAGGKQTVQLLTPLITLEKTPLAVRSAAVTALGRSVDGQKVVLQLVTSAKLPPDLNFVAANILLSSMDTAIKQEASKHLQLPATANSQPLPPVAELARRRGDAAAGAIIFRKQGTCINCHKVRGEGKEVGPDLSEIGSKLSREAMYVSILDPSAAISHNFETYMVITDAGRTFSGLLVSDTDDSLTLRTREGIDRKFDKDGLEEFQKQKLSLMPQDLQKLMTVDQLVDLVEYNLSLRKAGAIPNPQ